MITARGLSKRYGDVVALHDMNLDVAQGSIYALLGPNGAGKTTTINILTTLTQPDEGTAQVAGHDIRRAADAVRHAIGVTFQDLTLDRDLTGRQILDIHGRLYRQPATRRRQRIAELVQLVQLGDAIDRRILTYSGGMKRRLELARGLMTDPQVLFLDEPTQGLDPQNRVAIWEYVRDLSRRSGMTLLLTTHYMDEAEALADRIGIIDHGRNVVEGTPHDLLAELGTDVVRLSGSGNDGALIERLRSMPFVRQAAQSAEDRVIEIGVDQGSRRVSELVTQAAECGFTVESIEVTRPRLSDVFLKYTGRALRD